MRHPGLPGREAVGVGAVVANAGFQEIGQFAPQVIDRALLEEVGYKGERFSELLAFRSYMQFRHKRNQLFIKLIEGLASSPMRVRALCINNCNPQPVGQEVIGQGRLVEHLVDYLNWLRGCFFYEAGGLEKRGLGAWSVNWFGWFFVRGLGLMGISSAHYPDGFYECFNFFIEKYFVITHMRVVGGI
jgi:hypothetical protein